MQLDILAARTVTPAISGFPTGGQVVEASAGDFDDPAKLLAALVAAKVSLLEKNVPEEDITAFLPWSRVMKLLFADKAISRDFNGDNGSISEGRVFRIAGMDIVGTNRVPSTNITTGMAAGDAQAKYAGNFTKTKGLVMHKSAVGTVKLMDLSIEREYSVRHQASLTVAKYSVGHGVLRPESAVELTAA